MFCKTGHVICMQYVIHLQRKSHYLLPNQFPDECVIVSLKIVRHLFKVSYFLPSYLKEGAWKVKLQHQFGEYYQSLQGEELDSIRGHYISCYDRDILSGAYQFDVKVMFMHVHVCLLVLCHAFCMYKCKSYVKNFV